MTCDGTNPALSTLFDPGPGEADPDQPPKGATRRIRIAVAAVEECGAQGMDMFTC